MTPQTLIDELESLAFAARWARMIELGRRARSDPQAQALITALDACGEFYPRQLALMAAHGSGDRRILFAALTGASQSLASMAVPAAVRALDDAELAAAISALPRRRRKFVVTAAAAGRRAAVTAAFDSFDAEEQARLLSCATAAFCAARLKDDVETLSVFDWRALARRHPQVVHREIVARIAAGGLSDPLARKLPEILAALCLRAADLALDLLAKAAVLKNFRPGGSDDRALLDALAPRFPLEVADYFLARAEQTIPCLPLRWLIALDPERRRKLYRLSIGHFRDAGLKRLPPAIRAELYASELWERQRTREGALPFALVALAPQAERRAEARRAWTAAQLAAYPQRRMAYLAFLPFDEARREAEPFLRQPDGDLRAAANAALVDCGRFDPARLQDILDHALGRRNEQDPVRRAMLQAFAALPPGRWTPAHLPAIGALIDSALAASDASGATFSACLSWLLRLGLGVDPPFAFIAETLRPLVEKLGGLHGVAGLPDLFSERTTRALAPTLAAIAEVWRGRSNLYAIVSLAARLGPRIEAAPGLLDIVESLTADPRRAFAEAALKFLAGMRDRRRFLALAPKLFAEDNGWVVCDPVAQLLDRRRQDLLAGVLRPRLYAGRFSSGETAILPTFSAFRLWTQRQQATYAESLTRIARAPGRDARTLRETIDALAAMPALDVAALAQFAQADAPDKAVRDMALWALGRVDAARGAPELLHALADERARVAVYALRAVVLDLPPAEAMRLVSGVPLHPVTVGKEAIRLAGDLRTAEACEWLDALAARDDLHADLRLALLRAYWSYLERPQTWDALDAAARSDRLGLARAVVVVPQERLSPETRLRLAENQALLLANSHALVRLEALRRIAAAPDRAGMSRLRPALLAALGFEVAEAVRLAVSALIRLGASAETGARCAGIADPLAFPAAVEELQRLCLLPQAGAVEAAVALAEALAAQGRRIGAALRLALLAMPLDALQGWIERQAPKLHPDALADALAALRAVCAGARGEALIGLEPDLARSAEPWARRLGLAVVETRGAAKGWTKTLRARLDAYSADASPWIAEARERIVPPAGSEESERPAA